jgi:hypothetical protein
MTRKHFTGELAALGWSADVRSRGNFIVGVAQPPPASAAS